MQSRFLVVIVFNLIANFFVGSMQIPGCVISSRQAYCEGRNEPFSLLQYNQTLQITSLTLIKSFINGTIFTEDSDHRQITELSLQDCDLTMLSADAFKNLKSLKWLNINSKLNLENLNLEGLQLDALNLSFSSLKEHDLPNLSAVLNQVPNVTRLAISGNTFEKINASIFYPLKYLEVLIADNCSIETIWPYKLDATLKEVDVKDNLLKELPFEIFEASKDSLEILRLDRNPIQKITSGSTEFKFLTLISLGGTKLECSCGLRTWMKADSIVPEDVMCHDHSDEEALVTLVKYLEKCRADGPNTSLVVVIVILVIVFVAVVVGCLVHRYLSNRRRSFQANKSVKYSAVYRETVESSGHPTHGKGSEVVS